jgi:hypothetical protein
MGLAKVLSSFLHTFVNSSIYVVVVWMRPHGGVGREQARKTPVSHQLPKTSGGPLGSMSLHHKNRGIMVNMKAFDEVL